MIDDVPGVPGVPGVWVSVSTQQVARIAKITIESELMVTCTRSCVYIFVLHRIVQAVRPPMFRMAESHPKHELGWEPQSSNSTYL